MYRSEWQVESTAHNTVSARPLRGIACSIWPRSNALQAQAQSLFAVTNTLLDLVLLIILFGLRARGPLRRSPGFSRLALFRQRDKFREIHRGHIWKAVPESRLQVRKLTIETGNRLDVHRSVRA